MILANLNRCAKRAR
jgi:hypothetical protein